ncbi:MAG: hypothetical protein CM1200mP16_14090 [Nitrospina sp.]|nr:MAG: hypothetical protein CM1200mP16_14090 [Nitrospina sp.]
MVFLNLSFKFQREGNVKLPPANHHPFCFLFGGTLLQDLPEPPGC